jgi:hypothetical protein
VSLVLILTDADGNEVLKTRTTAQGQFEFESEPGKNYKIIPGSKFYEPVVARAIVHSGDRIGLQLQQK